MKASELRIGNYISLGPFIYDNWYEVDGEILAEFAKEGCDPYKPIPLTEEWLVKFGFIKGGLSKKASNSFYEIAVGGSGLFINPDNGVVWIERNDNVFNNPALIEYVHQLQNLYFALTGEELTIKEI